MMEIITAISTVGFPIVAFLLIYLDLRKLIIKNTEVTTQLLTIIKERG